MSYDFKEVTEHFEHHETVVKECSDAVYLYNHGKLIEDLVPYFRTYYANGRGEGKKTLSTAETSRDGNIVLSSRFSAKTYTITGVIDAPDTPSLNDSLMKLNNICNQGKQYFQFNDDRAFWYEGYFSVDTVESSTLSPKVTINIVCETPFKESNDLYYIHLDEPLNIELGIETKAGEGYRPNYIGWKYNQNSNVTSEGVHIWNERTGKQIKTLPYAESRDGESEAVLNFETGELKINGYVANQHLDISTNVSDFLMKHGDVLKCDKNVNEVWCQFNRIEVG